eukprot:CAMPEP_0181272164 /NCGR_PEP_ID=MMETSP1097-20121128/7835_1 /TAXON_ID=35684 /ORGANISM="Pseudopedinella elastica, Strain CCMP716" /LENGTH=36 /DNA_ID= /DNA_START= /DNA_END= /DNA_ORIENTATION=
MNSTPPLKSSGSQAVQAARGLVQLWPSGLPRHVGEA